MSLENYECLIGLQGRRLKLEETEHYVRVFGIPEPACKEIVGKMIGDGHWVLQVLTDRLDRVGALNGGLTWDQIIAPKLAVMLAIMMDRPGVAVMWAYSLWRHYAKIRKTVDLAEWSHVWAMGVPADEEMRTVWYQQKDIDPKPFDDNLIDHFENWININPESVVLPTP